MESGFGELVWIYKPIDIIIQLKTPKLKMLIKRTEAFNAFDNKQWKKAIEGFSAIIDSLPFAPLETFLNDTGVRHSLAPIFCSRGEANFQVGNILEALDDVHTGIGLLVVPSSYPHEKQYDFGLRARYFNARRLLSMIYQKIGNINSFCQQATICYGIAIKDDMDMKNEVKEIVKNAMSLVPMEKPFYLKNFKYQSSLFTKTTTKRKVDTTDRFMVSHCSLLWKGIIYIFGGRDVNGVSTNRVLKINLKEKNTTDITSKSIVKPGKFHSASMVSYGGIFYLFGGIYMTSPEHWFYSFDPNTEQWNIQEIDTTSRKPPCIAQHTSIIYRDQMIVYGGSNKNKICGEIFSFDFITKTWRLDFVYKRNPLYPFPRKLHQAWILDDKMFIFSGICSRKLIDNNSEANDYNFDDMIWYWSFEKKKWNKYHFLAGNQPSVRADFGSVVINGNVYILGGYGHVSSYNPKNDVISHVNLFNDAFELSRVETLNGIQTLEQGETRMRWKQLYFEKYPQFSKGHSMVTDGKNIYVTGGHNYKGIVDYVFEIKFDKKCENCAKTNEKMKQCGRCNTVYYCNSKCQQENWKMHKPNCLEK